MIPASTLAFSGAIHRKVRDHLFPGDGCEASAILLCARTPGPRHRLLVREALLVPYGDCAVRAPDAITWPGRWIEAALDVAESDRLSLILIHSHPTGHYAFSHVDDDSDRLVIPGLFQAFGDNHGSAIMIASGATRARLYTPHMERVDVDLVTIAGDELTYWWHDPALGNRPCTRAMAFSSSMTDELGRLQAAVIGHSGTGSIVAEQLARLGFGKVITIDHDRVEARNLNRILNASRHDADHRSLKVQVFATATARHRGEQVAVPVAASIGTREAVIQAAQSDVLFCCVDTLEARQVADSIAAAFTIPLFDVGVVIPVRHSIDGHPAIADVCGRIDYVQPGGSTLQDRGVYSPAALRAEYLRMNAPRTHEHELASGYIKGVLDEAPAVITLNMRAGAACVNEFLARAYPFRLESNRLYARTFFSLAACEEEFTSEDCFDRSENPILGRGHVEPLLGLPALALPAARAMS
jgi:hypothetical protein